MAIFASILEIDIEDIEVINLKSGSTVIGISISTTG